MSIFDEDPDLGNEPMGINDKEYDFFLTRMFQ
jgi:hypothetical protein